MGRKLSGRCRNGRVLESDAAPCSSGTLEPMSLESSTAAAVLMERLGLSEDELLTVLAADPLAVLSGELDHSQELPILLTLTEEAAEKVADGVLRSWLRRAGPGGRPLDHLLARDFGAFEDDLATLERRGYVLRGGGGGRSA